MCDEWQEAPPDRLPRTVWEPQTVHGKTSLVQAMLEEKSPVVSPPDPEWVRRSIMRIFAPVTHGEDGTMTWMFKADGHLAPDVTLKVRRLADEESIPPFARALAALVPELVMAEILAAVAEGFCPAHRIPLDSGGASWLPWCSTCKASWCCGTPPLPEQPSRDGFTVSRIVFSPGIVYTGELRIGTGS